MKLHETKDRILYLIFFLILLSECRTENTLTNLQKAGPQPDGSILVPSNQLLHPSGSQVYFPGRPVDLALTPDEKYLLVKNKEDLDLIRLKDRSIIQTLPLCNDEASFTGLCLSPDGKRVLLTNATDRICIAEFKQEKLLQWRTPILLPYPEHGQPAPGGLCFNDKGNKLCVTLSRNNSLAIINLDDNSLIEVPVGAAPYTVICASDNKAYVSNWGGRLPSEGESTYNSSGTLILVDPETGIANNGSVSVIDLNRNIQTKNIEVGLHPCAMVLSPEHDKLYVACANSDIIAVINTSSDEVIENISVHVKENRAFGSSPNDMAISPDGKFLYVANGTDNAVCVIRTGTPAKVLGYIPTAWYPGSVILDKTGKNLYVANIKGIGSRNKRSDNGGFNSLDHVGSVSIIPVPGKSELKKMTETVDLNNSWAGKMREYYKSAGSEEKVPVPVMPGQVSLFRHVVYIIKENRTYDQVFGDMVKGNGDTSLLEFGRVVTPNHHLLAETFVLLDNFYCSGALSADGHQWTDEAYVTDYLEKSFGDFPRSYPYDGDDALAYASSGFIWDNVLRHGLTFRDYGEFVAPEIDPDTTFSEIYRDFIEGTGKIKIRARANLEQLEPYLCPTFIGFPNTVPDIYRAAEFIKELEEFEKNDNFPNFIIMELPNDHTSGTRPGMPTPESAVANNDLALGQIVEAISSSKFWKETCILVTEDDPQDGFDHVDGHRTVGLVISPYTRRGEVISTYYSQISMVRTIEDILGLPPMNQLDLSSDAMVDCFTGTPDFTPYKVVKNNIPLDEINPPLTSLTGDQLYWAEKSLEQNLDDVDRIDEDIFNRIIWHAVKGYDRPYPEKAGKQID